MDNTQTANSAAGWASELTDVLERIHAMSDNGRSVFTRHECARCEAYRDMQYDYNF